MYKNLLLFVFIVNLNAIDFTLDNQQLYIQLKEYDNKYKISQSKKWRDISGWEYSMYGYVANNQDLRAYSSIKGLENPQEDFVDFAMEYINPSVTTIENSIKCRTPNKYKFLKNQFKNFISPLEQKNIICTTIDKGFLNDIIFTDPLTLKAIDFGDINSTTVEGFELLYATPGTTDASEIAGHLLLRIKLNNNNISKKLKIENSNDIVVSFLANTTTNNITNNYTKTIMKDECTKSWFNLVENNDLDTLKSIGQSIQGLIGGFLTMMDIQTLNQTIKHYTIEEDRDLLRFELILTEQQKKNLLKRLFEAKKNYNAKYYFFTQNCASVLVKIIAQGIGNEEIKNFNPLTSAPNTLVAMFTRKGLAKPIYPSFYSYRNKGYMAQDLIKKIYNELTTKYENYNWPDITSLFDNDINKRLSFISSLRKFYKKYNKFTNQLWNINNLIQEAEMAYEHKDLYCKKYTSKVTTKAREFQIYLMKRKEKFKNEKLNISNLINEKFKKLEKEKYNEGINHTKLLPLTVALGKENKSNITHLELSLIKQNMGSLSNISMQRANSVNLASLTANIKNNYQLSNWSFTTLNIHKFKERLSKVPSIFSKHGHIGLGLNVLDYEGNYKENTFNGTIIGGELLFNLISSNNYNDYLFFSSGANINHNKDNEYDKKLLILPSYFQSLITIGAKREFQYQNKLTYNKSLNNDIKDNSSFNSELRYKLPKINEIMMIMKLSFKYNYIYVSKKTNKQLWLGLEILKW
ncbi:MAG: DUF4105 domain-containing protein [Campylobacterota bacterium]|nr:DUF4105 domain-containing protein [Campylobacterota bacterium]